ncbi:Sporulation-specific N-acetylmuramoyl-L-alanine amidase [[Flavobacterium] thermophilum]|nr:Sporulation-specific N-acetylmuramoyl-L-alanine amidase [Geobacillus sp. 12AMOR1]STO12516.1 Sporulation-specific N-acetylmuramoyl-L-alanine amidase [[Flavobacterium] thermophilum]
MAEFVQVIDPGHGGHDPGAVANGLREKDLTLKIALYTRDYIHELYEGVKVYLTRDKDVFVGLSERADFANRLNADHFCSIHINAGGGKGFESYIYNGSYSSKPKTQAFRWLYQAAQTEMDQAQATSGDPCPPYHQVLYDHENQNRKILYFYSHRVRTSTCPKRSTNGCWA